MASDKIVLVLDLGTDAMQAIEACVGDITVSDVRRASYSWMKAPPYTNCMPCRSGNAYGGTPSKQCFDIILRIEDPQDFSCVPKCT